MSELTLENINAYFWKAVANRQIDLNFVSQLEVFKSLTEAINDFKSDDTRNSEYFTDFFPGFFAESMLKSLKPEEPSKEKSAQTPGCFTQTKFYQLFNMDELQEQFSEDRINLLKADVQSIESSYIESTVVSQFALPEGIFVEQSSQA